VILAYRLEIVRRHVVGDVLPEDLTLYIGRVKVQACPNAGIDDLGERLREAVEAPRLWIRRLDERGLAATLRKQSAWSLPPQVPAP
jgi:hypothetical protein